MAASFTLLIALFITAGPGGAGPSSAATTPVPTKIPLSPSNPQTPHTPSLADAPALNPSNVGQLAQLAQVEYGQWQLVTALAWSPDGRWLAAAVGERIELLEFPGLQARASYRTRSLTHSLAFSPDSAWLAAASRDGFLRIWQTAAFAGVSEAAPGLEVEAHRKGANVTAFSPQFAQAAGPSGWLAASGGNDAVARFWDVSSGENTGLMVGGSFAVPSIAFLPDGLLLAVTNGDRIRLREVGSERIAGTFASDAPLYSLAVSPDGRLIASGGSDNLVRVWPVDSAYRTGQERYPDPALFTGHSGRGSAFRSLIWQVHFTPAGDLLASVGGDGALAVWKIDGDALIGASRQNGQILQHAPLALRPAHPGGATSLAFHPQARLIATGGLDGVILIWGIRDQ